MKKIVLILLLLSLNSCFAQKIEQAPLKKVNAWVQEKGDEVAKLQPSNPAITYAVPTGEFESNKEYVFWLEIHESNGRTRKATVVKYAITTSQAKAADGLSNRKIE